MCWKPDAPQAVNLLLCRCDPKYVEPPKAVDFTSKCFLRVMLADKARTAVIGILRQQTMRLSFQKKRGNWKRMINMVECL